MNTQPDRSLGLTIRSLADYLRANIDAIHWLDRISGLEEHCATALVLAPHAGIADDARICAPYASSLCAPRRPLRKFCNWRVK